MWPWRRSERGETPPIPKTIFHVAATCSKALPKHGDGPNAKAKMEEAATERAKRSRWRERQWLQAIYDVVDFSGRRTLHCCRRPRADFSALALTDKS